MRASKGARLSALLPLSFGEVPPCAKDKNHFALVSPWFAYASFRQLFSPDTVTDDISKGRRTRALREGLRALLGSAEPPLRQT
jgi:hypothetical protein